MVKDVDKLSYGGGDVYIGWLTPQLFRFIDADPVTRDTVITTAMQSGTLSSTVFIVVKNGDSAELVLIPNVAKLVVNGKELSRGTYVTMSNTSGIEATLSRVGLTMATGEPRYLITVSVR